MKKLEKTITVKRELKSTEFRNLIFDRNFRITITIDYVRFFELEKGQALPMEIREEGIFIRCVPPFREREAVNTE